MNNRRTLHPALDYTADDKPSKAVEQRFAKLHAEVFDGSGRLRAAYRPSPKPASPKKPTSLFIIDMLGNDGRLRPFVS